MDVSAVGTISFALTGVFKPSQVMSKVESEATAMGSLNAKSKFKMDLRP